MYGSRRPRTHDTGREACFEFRGQMGGKNEMPILTKDHISISWIIQLITASKKSEPNGSLINTNHPIFAYKTQPIL